MSGRSWFPNNYSGFAGGLIAAMVGQGAVFVAIVQVIRGATTHPSSAGSSFAAYQAGHALVGAFFGGVAGFAVGLFVVALVAPLAGWVKNEWSRALLCLAVAIVAMYATTFASTVFLGIVKHQVKVALAPGTLTFLNAATASVASFTCAWQGSAKLTKIRKALYKAPTTTDNRWFPSNFKAFSAWVTGMLIMQSAVWGAMLSWVNGYEQVHVHNGTFVVNEIILSVIGGFTTACAAVLIGLVLCTLLAPIVLRAENGRTDIRVAYAVAIASTVFINTLLTLDYLSEMNKNFLHNGPFIFLLVLNVASFTGIVVRGVELAYLRKGDFDPFQEYEFHTAEEQGAWTFGEFTPAWKRETPAEARHRREQHVMQRALSL